MLNPKYILEAKFSASHARAGAKIFWDTRAWRCDFEGQDLHKDINFTLKLILEEGIFGLQRPNI